MKANDIREMTPMEFEKALEEARREQLNLRIQQRTGQIENTARLRLVRRDIARMQTELTRRANAQSTQVTG